MQLISLLFSKIHVQYTLKNSQMIIQPTAFPLVEEHLDLQGIYLCPVLQFSPILLEGDELQ